MKILNEVHGDEICPSCNKDFEGRDIFDHFLEVYSGDKEKALETAGLYGWTEENPKSFSCLLGIETDQYDGVTWWQCPFCKATWKRFEWSDDKYL